MGKTLKNGNKTTSGELPKFVEGNKIKVSGAVKCNDKPDHFELQLENDQKLQFLLCSIKYGRDIFDEQLGVPVRFPSEIKVYESN